MLFRLLNQTMPPPTTASDGSSDTEGRSAAGGENFNGLRTGLSFVRNAARWFWAELGFARSPRAEKESLPKPTSLAVPLAVAIGLMLIIVTIPPPPMRLDIDVDSSLSQVLNYANERGLQHGKDLVFTYGPLGFLTFFYFSPHTPVLRLVVDVALSFTAAAGISLVAWRMRLVWRWLLLLVCAWVGANVWPRTDWLINCGLLGWGLLCFVESGRRLIGSATVFVLLGAFAALSKASFLVLVGVGITFISMNQLNQRRWRLGVGMLMGFLTVYFLGWVLAGQRLGNWGTYFRNSLAMIQGYNATLGWEGAEFVRAAGWKLAWCLPGIVLLRTLTAFTSTSARRRWRRFWLTLFVGWLTYAFWKHGWVRVDPFHVKMFLGSVAVVALAMEVLPSANQAAKFIARACGLVGCLIALGAIESLYLPSLTKSLTEPARAFGENARSLINPVGYFSRMRENIAANQAEAQLPRLREIVGKATVDVYGQHPGYTLFNEMDYRPRPVFQSYAACNATLMKLNEEFYGAPSRPEFVLFQLVAMDGKFPVLEDAYLLRQLLANYTPVAAEQRYLLLKAGALRATQLKLLEARATTFGRRIDLSQFGNVPLWLEVDVQPTLLGRLRNFFSRPAVVKIATWRDSTQQWNWRHRAPPAMLAAGFVASPLLLRSEDVLNLYAGTNQVYPLGYSFEIPPEDAPFWSATVRYRIWQIESQLGGNLPTESARQIWLQSTNAALLPSENLPQPSR